MFTGATAEERLDPSDAMFVDVLHTDMNCKYWHAVFVRGVRDSLDVFLWLKKSVISCCPVTLGYSYFFHVAFGLRGQHGHIDYYANGGSDQPGCPKTIFSGKTNTHTPHNNSCNNSQLLSFVGKSYFVCDHQRSVFLYLCALNRTCSLTAYPCSSYSDFLDGRCLQCEAFKPAPCPMLGERTAFQLNPESHSICKHGKMC